MIDSIKCSIEPIILKQLTTLLKCLWCLNQEHSLSPAVTSILQSIIFFSTVIGYTPFWVDIFNHTLFPMSYFDSLVIRKLVLNWHMVCCSWNHDIPDSLLTFLLWRHNHYPIRSYSAACKANQLYWLKFSCKVCFGPMLQPVCSL